MCAGLRQHAAACLNLVEAADPSTRAKMRTCAQQDFRESLAHSPPGTDRLVATRGLAEATRIARDNSADYAANARELTDCRTSSARCRAGRPTQRKYAADTDLSRVLTRNVPPAHACATLKGAEAELPAASTASDLGQNLTTLRSNITTAMKNRSCV